MDVKVCVKNPEGKEWLGRLACRWDSWAYFCFNTRSAREVNL